MNWVIKKNSYVALFLAMFCTRQIEHCKKIVIFCTVCLIVVVGISIGSYFTGMYIFVDDINQLLLFVNPNEVIFETDQKFLSVALDISFMQCLFHQLDDKDWQKLEELSGLLSPAYLRFGGVDADRTIFSLNNSSSEFIRNSGCEDDPAGKIIITGKDWLRINEFARKSNLNLILDLNVLLKKGSEWDSSNAEAIIMFSEQNGLSLDFQLGNEPNSFPHVFNTTLTGSQLAVDFQKLKALLRSTKLYRESKLIGPDVTRPKLEGPSLKYLEDFLSKGIFVDVASWHQYNLNGRTATLVDFLNPENFNLLSDQIESVVRTVRKYSRNLPIWISETSSAYGGGAPHLSNNFVASFLWLDKLGVAAKLGMSVVIRQSLFKGYYALINENFTPAPDFWISYFYKNAVGSKVLSMKTKYSDEVPGHLRFYCHCARSNSTISGNIVIYGMNLSNHTELIIASGMSVSYPIHAFVFRPEFNNLKAKTTLLNSNQLIYNETTFDDMLKMGKETEFPLALTSYSIGFWILKDTQGNACIG